MTKRFAAIGCSVALLLAATAVQAQIFRCEGPGGVVEYTNAPPAGGQNGRNCKTVDATITVIPAPKPVVPVRPAGASTGTAPGTGAPAAAPAPGAPAAAPGAAPATPATAPGVSGARTSPEGFPKVDPAAQRARDSDRRRILEDESKKEEARLAELQKEYNAGEPERRGDERNYQKYLDRVQRLKEDIARTEGNLATIRRELSAVKN